MRALASIPLIIIGLLVFVGFLYFFNVYTTYTIKLSETQKKTEELLRRSSTEYLRIDSVELLGSVLNIRATALESVDVNRISVFLNHKFVGRCETLSCVDETNNGYLIPGESVEINVPFPGICDLTITLEYSGSTVAVERNDICVWRCRRPITISSVFDFNNYPVHVELNTSNFDFTTTDGNDLRFYDGNTSLDYWIEQWTATYASIWVEVNVINGDKNIYMYYCNPYTFSESNGYETFFWFDFNDANLMLVFHFDGTTTAVIDETGVYGGTIFNATRVSGYYGGGILFDGNDDWIETNFTPQLNEITILFWVYTLVQPNSVSTIVFDGIFNRTMGVDNVSRPYIWFSTPEGALYGTTIINNNWYHIVGQASASALFQRIYVNSNLENTTSITSVTSKPAGSSMYLGGEPSGGAVAWDFNGILDELIVFGRLLSIEEINALYVGYLERLSNVWVVRYRRDPEPVVVVGNEETGSWVLT